MNIVETKTQLIHRSKKKLQWKLKCYELNNNEDMTYQILLGRAKAVLKRKCRVICAYIRKKEILRNQLRIHLKKLQKIIANQSSRMKEANNKNNMEKINEI